MAIEMFKDEGRRETEEQCKEISIETAKCEMDPGGLKEKNDRE